MDVADAAVDRALGPVGQILTHPVVVTRTEPS
jgi:hypothetical protein